jgi:VWFA-related protein
MRRPVRCAVFAVCAIAGLGLESRARSQDQAPVFRVGTSAVSVDVSVRDRSRKPVTGLTAADFTVLDNGVAQKIANVSFGVKPIDVTIGLDVSQSVTGLVLERLRRAVAQLMGDLRRDDRLKLVMFQTQIHRAMDFTADARAVDRAMRAVPAGGGTALFDTLSVAMVGASDPDRRQLVVFFTDGIDSGSASSPAVLEVIAQRSRATLVFVVATGLGTIPSGSGVRIVSLGSLLRPIDPLLTRLATDTGGSVLSIQRDVDLGSTFRRVLEDFRSTYVLYYSPAGVAAPGFHTISVQVARPGTTVLARRGYFGG